jgi:dihydrofolate reductase
MRLSIVVAVAKNRVIGNDNQMPWHLPADFAWFRKITTGHPIIMGRKTFESIGRPLPGRRNIVVSRNPDFCADGVEVVTSLEKAINICLSQPDCAEAFVIGGAMLYAEALPRVDRIYLTEVDASPAGGTLFPAMDKSCWRELTRARHEADEKNIYAMDFVVLERK